MTSFSSDKGQPPTRFRPGPGQTGAAAAHSALGAGRGRPSGKERRSSGGGGNTSAGASHGNLGLPAQPPPDPGPADYRHLELINQYRNIKDLGRDIDFGIWAINNGHTRDLFKPGQMPFDVLEDTA